MDRDPTLHLPRILCLHGGGTNRQIFRMQCRAISARLQRNFRLVFAQGPFPARPGPDVTQVYKNYGPFHGWLRSANENSYFHADPPSSATEVVDQIQDALITAICTDDLQGGTGDVVGLLGFSQGARMAASILYAHQHSARGTGSLFGHSLRFAVLLAGRGPLVWLLPDMQTAMPPEMVDAAEPAEITVANDFSHHHAGSLLRMPTLHVHGLEDPNLELHRCFLAQYCRADSVSLLEWYGGHRVPIKTMDVDRLVQLIFKLSEGSQQQFSQTKLRWV